MNIKVPLRLTYLVFALIVVLPSTGIHAQSQNEEPLVVWLVRHAEKVDASRNPELSEIGKTRSEDLAEILRDSGIQHIHTSNFIRTRNTAAPLADRLGLNVQLYDPANLPTLVQQLKTTGGRHLVVGHSNTTPEVVELLGGEPGKPIDEQAEYDRLYIVITAAAGNATTLLMRYGSPPKMK